MSPGMRTVRVYASPAVSTEVVLSLRTIFRTLPSIWRNWLSSSHEAENRLPSVTSTVSVSVRGTQSDAEYAASPPFRWVFSTGIVPSYCSRSK